MSDWISIIFTPQNIASMVVILIILHLSLGVAAYGILLERKIAAWTQDRIGPNRVGPMGLLQPLADGLKLFLKEDIVPANVDKALFVIAPILTVIPALISFAVIPWAGWLELPDFLGGHRVLPVGGDISIGILYLVAVTSLGVYGVALGGWASNNKFSFLGGLRAAAQMISYEIPMGLTLLCIVLASGTLLPTDIVVNQLEGSWNIIHQPLGALIFYICMLAEGNRAPFDLSEAEQELVGGWHTEYSSMKWAMFFLGEYVHMFTGSAFFVVLFLGGWSINPFSNFLDLSEGGGIFTVLFQFTIVFGKIAFLIFLTMIIRWTLPRFRFDQLMRLAWEGMIPISLLLLLTTSLFVYMGWLEYLWIGSIIDFGIIWFVGAWLPASTANKKLGLLGSRFSPVDPQ